MFDINPILLGLWSGLLIAFFGYLKTVKEDENGVPKLEEFQKVKFIQTIAVGAIAGAVAQYMGISYDAALTVLVSMGIVTIVEYVIKTIVRWLRIPLAGRSLLKLVSARKEPKKYTRGMPAKEERISVKDFQKARQWILHSRILEAALGIVLAIAAVWLPVVPNVGPSLTSWILIGSAIVLVLHALIFGSE